jgi:hypothetical protein
VRVNLNPTSAKTKLYELVLCEGSLYSFVELFQSRKTEILLIFTVR